ncbi:hypothetical protein P2Q00_00760 [Streptomyces coacervatus]|uniref:hypothetical protein n=1 Tax=Streptomyces coacervatus TaxID=647381 RepID=UPI0023DB9E42|nr:hypothetical protein [Streptomyces coacervatus]MDF2263975.1 hypothetical protein [Streptomyces coacervatus]
MAPVCAETAQAAGLTLAQLRAPGEVTLASDPAPVVHTMENPGILALSFEGSLHYEHPM